MTLDQAPTEEPAAKLVVDHDDKHEKIYETYRSPQAVDLGCVLFADDDLGSYTRQAYDARIGEGCFRLNQ